MVKDTPNTEIGFLESHYGAHYAIGLDGYINKYQISSSSKI